MTDIGVLTFHNNENRGAILQAYGVCRLLSEAFDANVEVVEYRTESKETSRKRSLVANKKPWTIPDRIRDRKVVEEFFETELPAGEDSIITDNHELAVDWLREQEYDGLVTGSDEIWKITGSEKSGIRAFVSPSRPFPNLYFLDESIPGTKFSYAASANTTNPDVLSAETLETFKRHLEAYDHISVRDRHTKQLLEDLGIEDVTQVPDPTLMIDIPTRNARSILENQGIDLEEPLLGFHGPDVPIFNQICDLYRDRGYQIVATTASQFADVEMRGIVDPFEYYSLYEHFDMVVTNSLHSSIFSIKHGTPFATIDTSSVYENIESKTYSLLHDFDMLDRHFTAIHDNDSEFFAESDRLEADLDMQTIKNKIKKEKQKGEKFLENIEFSGE